MPSIYYPEDYNALLELIPFTKLNIIHYIGYLVGVQQFSL